MLGNWDLLQRDSYQKHFVLFTVHWYSREYHFISYQFEDKLIIGTQWDLNVELWPTKFTLLVSYFVAAFISVILIKRNQ